MINVDGGAIIDCALWETMASAGGNELMESIVTGYLPNGKAGDLDKVNTKLLELRSSTTYQFFDEAQTKAVRITHEIIDVMNRGRIPAVGALGGTVFQDKLLDSLKYFVYVKSGSSYKFGTDALALMEKGLDDLIFHCQMD